MTKISESHICDKDLIYRIYKELWLFNNKENKNWCKKWVKDVNEHDFNNQQAYIKIFNISKL